jgi:peptide/nickel transport system ATP-binding protein
VLSLKIESLNITDTNTTKTLLDIYNIHINHSLAIVGQSGSGKSLTLKSILGLTPSNLDIVFKYDANFELNFKNIGFIPQNPFTSLSGMTKIKKQFFCEDTKIDKLLKMVNLNLDTKDKYPVQLSGGQLQRVVIAIALSNKPKILLLDEPTTALDSTSKEIILDLIRSLQKQLGFLVLFVSHDIDSVKDIANEIIVLKNGKICEKGTIDQILKYPNYKYTKQLISSSFKNREFRV